MPVSNYFSFIKLLVILSATPLLLATCNWNSAETDFGQQNAISLSQDRSASKDTLPELTPSQLSAFDALDTLQVNSAENTLYSTFARIYQPFYPPDTSFTISRPDLLSALKQFIQTNCTGLPLQKRLELVEIAVLAQQDYLVLHCSDFPGHVNYANGLPKTGTWVLPNVLGRRDVILVW